MPVLIQFTAPEQFRPFASHSQSACDVQVAAREWGHSAYVHVDRRGRAGAGSARLAFAIPLRAIDGDVDALLLTVLGDGGGAVVSLTCRRASDPEFEVRFPPIDFTDRRTIAAALPAECGSQRGLLHIERLNIDAPSGAEHTSLGLFSLAAIGVCRVASPAIA